MYNCNRQRVESLKRTIVNTSKACGENISVDDAYISYDGTGDIDCVYYSSNALAVYELFLLNSDKTINLKYEDYMEIYSLSNLEQADNYLEFILQKTSHQDQIRSYGLYGIKEYIAQNLKEKDNIIDLLDENNARKFINECNVQRALYSKYAETDIRIHFLILLNYDARLRAE